MKKLWITYCWEDNKNGDVDFVAQELGKAGIEVRIDKWTIEAGKRLWEQIDKFITDPAECDAWAIYATPNSLGSQPCKEEIAYALQRALEERNGDFPFVGIFPSSVDNELIPSAIRTRLYVSLIDPHWVERVKSSVEGLPPNIPKEELAPYLIELKVRADGQRAIEVRPRAGIWSPFLCTIPLAERAFVNPQLSHGPRGSVPRSSYLRDTNAFADGEHWCMIASNIASPTESFYVLYDRLPSKLIFGDDSTPDKFFATFTPD